MFRSPRASETCVSAYCFCVTSKRKKERKMHFLYSVPFHVISLVPPKPIRMRGVCGKRRFYTNTDHAYVSHCVFYDLRTNEICYSW